MVVKNYTGDVMNFEMAAEMAEMEGITVKYVVTNDDVAVKDSLYTVGRRGVAGTVFVHKIAGAMAETGASLDEVHAVAQKVIDNVRTMGAAIAPCTVPRQESRDSSCQMMRWKWESGSMESREPTGSP